MQAFCGNLLSLKCVSARVCLRFYMLSYSYYKHKLIYLFILNKSEPFDDRLTFSYTLLYRHIW